MSAWRIASWDRVLARGTIASEVGELPFDAAIAMVDHFDIGEEVEVSLRRDGASYVVTSIAPVAWRAPDAPAPRIDHDAVLAEIASVARGRSLTMRGLDEEGTLTIVIDAILHEPPASILLDGCIFVQLATELRDLAAVSAYAASDFVRDCPDVAKHWPALDPRLTVFRFEPHLFAEKAGYVVAYGIRLVSARRG
jgi:hypothetical protein